MTHPPVIFINVGWMAEYKGSKGDEIEGGGSYVDENRTGGEIFNFKEYRGRYYGYGRPANDSIALERLGASKGASFVDGILVVWVAKSRVIGWYENATVYRACQSAPLGSSRVAKGVDGGYYATATKTDCKLVEQYSRTFTVPRAFQVEGGMGRYVWYAEGENSKSYLRKLLGFIRSHGKPTTKKSKVQINHSGAGRQIDPEKRKRIEKAAVREVKRYYRKEKYRVKDRQGDNCGWDLEARKDGNILRLEVKGVGGRVEAVELTPNEYICMKANLHSYRVCIVTNALSTTKTLSIYGYVSAFKQWLHHEDSSPIQITPISVETARLHR